MPLPNAVRKTGLSRRQFIYYSALAATLPTLSACSAPAKRKLTANDKLNIGVVGTGGKGASDTAHCSGENIDALCDVDSDMAARAKQKHPQANVYQDFRKMLEKEKSLDAIIVATPDHLHATIAAMAIRMGKHVYCQKPLTQTVYEARLLRTLAKKHGVATQMGNQGSAEDGLRRAVEVVQSGLIGSVSEVHVWSNRPIWPQGMDRPEGEDPVPEHLDWDLWFSPAPKRPFKNEWSEHPAKCARRGRGTVYDPLPLRGWEGFGTGALGYTAFRTAP